MLQFFEKIFNRINTNVISVNNTTQIIGNRSGEYVVNGKTYKGNNISVINGVVYIDGKVVDKSNVGTNNPIIINIKGKVYILDAQAGVLSEISSKRADKYFDINYGNSFLVRMDDKKINRSILQYNDEKYLIPWDDEKDIAYMKTHHML